MSNNAEWQDVGCRSVADPFFSWGVIDMSNPFAVRLIPQFSALLVAGLLAGCGGDAAAPAPSSAKPAASVAPSSAPAVPASAAASSAPAAAASSAAASPAASVSAAPSSAAASAAVAKPELAKFEIIGSRDLSSMSQPII